MKEYVDVIDEENNVLDSVSRNEIQKGNLLHRTVFVFVLNSNGKLFVQKRSKNKKTFPGKYGIGAGGVVTAGESYEEAAKRELKEELGIKKAELGYMFDFRFKSKEENYKSRVYKCVYDGKIELHEKEIEKGGFKTIEETKELAKQGKLCPDTKLFFERFLEDSLKKQIIAQKAVIKKSNKYLIMLRAPDAHVFPLHWDFPGGKLEQGEDPIKGLVREVFEETSLKIKPLKVVGEYSIISVGKPVLIRVYSSKLLGGKLKLSHEHIDSNWAPREKILKLKTEPYLRMYFEENE